MKSFWKRLTGFFYDKETRPHYNFSKIGKMRVHNITDPDLARTILKDMSSFEGPAFVRKTFSKIAGSAMIFDEGESWEIMHGMLAESFSVKNVERKISPIVMEECNRMIEGWAKRKDIDDVEHDLLHMTGMVIMRTVFSDTISRQDAADIISEANKVIGASRQPTGLAWVFKKLGVPYDHTGFLPSIALRVLGVSYEKAGSVPKVFRKSAAIIDKKLYNLIDARRKLAEQPDDVLGKLLTARRPDGTALTNQEIRDQIVMLMVAGHETTAEALTFSVLELLKNPHEQKPLRDEFNAVAGSAGVLKGADYNKLPRTQNAFMEAMRLHPPVIMSTREAVKDKTIDGVHFEKHDLIKIDLREIHKDPALWPDADKFIPSRFEKNRRPKAYLPFGVGPRICLGFSMSMYEGTLCLSQIFNKLDIEAVDLPKHDAYFFTSRPDGKMKISIKPRKPD